MIGLKDSRQFFSQWEAKPKPIAPCTRDFSRALNKLQVIARNCDWFIALFAPVVVGRGNFALVLVFRKSFENRSNGQTCRRINVARTSKLNPQPNKVVLTQMPVFGLKFCWLVTLLTRLKQQTVRFGWNLEIHVCFFFLSFFVGLTKLPSVLIHLSLSNSSMAHCPMPCSW